jgi:chromosomal replication initiation ATPase DnaA
MRPPAAVDNPDFSRKNTTMPASIWEQVLGRIETKVNRHSFYTWFKPTSLISDSGQTITVLVPNSLFKDWLTKRYNVKL